MEGNISNLILFKLEKMDKTMEERFDRVDEHLDRIDERLDRVEERLDRVEERLDRVEERLDRVEERLDEVEERLDEVEERLVEVEKEVRIVRTTLENEIRVNIQRVAEGHLDLYRKLNESQRYSDEVEMLGVQVRVQGSELERLKAKVS